MMQQPTQRRRPKYRVGDFVIHKHFGALKILGSWKEEDRIVYDSTDGVSVTNYNVEECEIFQTTENRFRRAVEMRRAIRGSRQAGRFGGPSRHA